MTATYPLHVVYLAEICAGNVHKTTLNQIFSLKQIALASWGEWGDHLPTTKPWISRPS